MRDTPISEVCKECRQRSGLTQTQLALKINYDQAIISNLENGKIPQPSYALIKQIGLATNGMDLINLHMNGGDTWKKLRTMESILGSIKQVMEQVNLFRVKKSVRPPLR